MDKSRNYSCKSFAAHLTKNFETFVNLFKDYLEENLQKIQGYSLVPSFQGVKCYGHGAIKTSLHARYYLC